MRNVLCNIRITPHIAFLFCPVMQCWLRLSLYAYACILIVLLLLLVVTRYLKSTVSNHRARTTDDPSGTSWMDATFVNLVRITFAPETSLS